MRKIHEKKWSELSAVWHEFYEKSLTATPFQSYEFLTFTKKGKSYRRDLFRLVGIKEWNLVLYDDGKPVAIAPLLIKKKQGKYRVYMRGHFTAANQLDFIYESWSYEDFKFLMDYIQDKLGHVSFMLDRVSEKTVTCGYLKTYFASRKIEENECFSIPIPARYNEWLETLSRSSRRNLTKYCNRLERENLVWSVDFYCNQSIGEALCGQMMRVYASRFLEKNGFCFGIIRVAVIRLLQIFMMRDKMTRWMNRGDGNYHAVLRIGAEVGAFYSGRIYRGKRVISSRVGLHTK